MGRPAGSKNKTTVSQAVEEAVDELKQDIPQIVEDAVKEALEEVKENVSATLPVEPVVEYHPQEEKIIIPKTPPAKEPVANPDPTKILVDKKLFYKMIRTLVVNQVVNYTGFAAIRAAGQMLGAKTYQEEQEIWQIIKSEL